jgi:sugar phosphate isomerase/epimerase
MQIRQIAAQLYTLRDFCKTPNDIAQTLKRVRSIGYEAVQVSGIAPIPEEELKAMLDGEGLTCCATHEATRTILEDTASVIERLQKLDCQFTAVPSPGSYDLSTREAALTFAAKVDAAGRMMRMAGQTLCYHNHHLEFVRFDEKPLLEILYDETDSQSLQGEIDTYWIQYGGASPLEWCRKLHNRLPLIHLKDYGISAEKQPVFRELGRGNLNWDEILPAAEAAGCQWFIVEQDTCERDPFDALQISFEFLAARCH